MPRARYTSWHLAEKFNPRRNNGTSTPAGTAFQFPTNRQLRINGVLTRDELLAGTRDTVDSHGDPTMVVMKVGGTTDLTVGRFAGLEAYICDAAGVESVALAIYNYEISPAEPASASAASTKGASRIFAAKGASRIFAAKGDSGSLVFNGEGRMVGILHSGGLTEGGSSHAESGSSHAESGSSHAESSSSHAESGSSHAESSSSHPTKARTSHISYAIPAWWAIEQIRAQYPHAEFDRERF